MAVIEPRFLYREYGPAPQGADILVTIGIPTYRRESQVRSFLERLRPMVETSRYRDRIELVISNNDSPDRTEDVINQWLERAPEFHVRVYTHQVNIGGEPNFRFIYEQARGSYVWSCSDHDVIHAEEFDRLLADVDRIRPDACISSFVNHGTAKDQITLSSGAETAIVTDLAVATRQCNDLGKLSQYVMQRRPLSATDQSFSVQASEGRVWFAALSLRLFMTGRQMLLLRTRPIGHTGLEAHDLAYSVRVYGEIRGHVLAALGDHPDRDEIARQIPRVNVMGPLVGHLLRNTLGLSSMKLDCAQSDFEFMKRNLAAAIVSNWRNAFKIPVILAFFPLRYRWRAAREDWTGATKG